MKSCCWKGGVPGVDIEGRDELDVLDAGEVVDGSGGGGLRRVGWWFLGEVSYVDFPSEVKVQQTDSSLEDPAGLAAWMANS